MKIARSARAFGRHTRLWPTAFGCALLANGARDDLARAALELWFARGWPLVVRRADELESSAPDGNIAVGLPLPPSLGKERLGFSVTTEGVAAHAPPLALDDVVAALQGEWQRALSPLARDAAGAGIALRVFGSAAWQAQTGLVYLHELSDIDLLVEPEDISALDAAIALFERFERRTTLRLDGEIVFPGGDAVAWREWNGASIGGRVLVKRLAGAALLQKRALAQRLERVPA